MNVFFSPGKSYIVWTFCLALWNIFGTGNVKAKIWSLPAVFFFTYTSFSCWFKDIINHNPSSVVPPPSQYLYMLAHTLCVGLKYLLCGIVSKKSHSALMLLSLTFFHFLLSSTVHAVVSEFSRVKLLQRRYITTVFTFFFRRKRMKRAKSHRNNLTNYFDHFILSR